MNQAIKDLENVAIAWQVVSLLFNTDAHSQPRFTERWRCEWFSLSLCVCHKIYFAHRKLRWPNHLQTTLVKAKENKFYSGKKNVVVYVLYACGFIFLKTLTVFSSLAPFVRSLICLIHATASIQVAILFLLLCHFRFVSH